MWLFSGWNINTHGLFNGHMFKQQMFERRVNGCSYIFFSRQWLAWLCNRNYRAMLLWVPSDERNEHKWSYSDIKRSTHHEMVRILKLESLFVSQGPPFCSVRAGVSISSSDVDGNSEGPLFSIFWQWNVTNISVRSASLARCPLTSHNRFWTIKAKCAELISRIRHCPFGESNSALLTDIN